jgi:hypothetical protein
LKVASATIARHARKHGSYFIAQDLLVPDV